MCRHAVTIFAIYKVPIINSKMVFMEKKKLTAANGRPIADNQNSQTAGQRGPMVFTGSLVSGEVSPL